MIIPGEYENPRQFTVRKTFHPWSLLALRSCTVWQDCQSPATTGSMAQRTCTVLQELKSFGNKIFLWTVNLRMTKSPALPYYARLFESLELYWSFDELYWNEAPLSGAFLKILYENADKNENRLDGEIIKTSKPCNEIICRPPQSRETIPWNRIHD